MNRILFLLFLAFNVNTYAQTQHQMHNKAREEYKKSDLELNMAYQKILTEYKTDSTFIDQLKKTQRIWIDYRDAELDMKFPAENKRSEYGSVYPMCVSLYLKNLTDERTRKLKVWLNGIEEGDMCAGSIKTN